MRPFKFFRGIIGIESRTIHRNSRNYLGLRVGELQWITTPLAMIFYIEQTEVNGIGGIPEISMNLMSESIQSITLRIPSYTQFIESNSDKVIFVYRFINQQNNIEYTSENFNLMPRDVPLIFRGVLKNLYEEV